MAQAARPKPFLSPEKRGMVKPPSPSIKVRASEWELIPEARSIRGKTERSIRRKSGLGCYADAPELNTLRPKAASGPIQRRVDPPSVHRGAGDVAAEGGCDHLGANPHIRVFGFSS